MLVHCTGCRGDEDSDREKDVTWERWEGVWLERGEAPSYPLQLTTSHSAAETLYAQVYRLVIICRSGYTGPFFPP